MSGPRLNRVKARECVEALGLKVVKSDGHGIHIERYSNHSGIQIWRVFTGGGIAGNSDSAWLAPVSRGASGEPHRGPFWTKAQLTRALRVWRREHRAAGKP